MKQTSEKILSAAASAIREWHTNTITLDDCIDKIRSEAPDVTRSASSILFEYFRHKSFLDDLVMRSVSRGTIKPELKAVAVCALTQALFQTAIAGESAVNVAVDHVKHSKYRSAAGFLNAVLRNALRTCGKGPYPPSFPDSLRKRWEQAFGSNADPAIRACAENPPVTFRLRSGNLPDELAAAVPVDADFAPEFHFYAMETADVLLKSEAFRNGDIYIQDPATALSVSLCGDRVRGRVLDACAAPGGKTVMLHDVSAGSAEITAADRSVSRMAQMNENFQRLHLKNIAVLELDAGKPSLEPESFDLVFLDAPCSNTGVSRRRPDALWRFDAKRLSEVAALQNRILEGIAPLVAPGGALLYSTCSVEPEEDSCQMEAFLQRHPEFRPEKSRLLLPSPHHDGAFAALLFKKQGNNMPD